MDSSHLDDVVQALAGMTLVLALLGISFHTLCHQLSFLHLGQAQMVSSEFREFLPLVSVPDGNEFLKRHTTKDKRKREKKRWKFNCFSSASKGGCREQARANPVKLIHFQTFEPFESHCEKSRLLVSTQAGSKRSCSLKSKTFRTQISCYTRELTYYKV